MSKRVFLHILFWLAYSTWGILSMISYSSSTEEVNPYSVLSDLFHLPLKITVTYLVMYVLLPYYTTKKQQKNLYFIIPLLVIAVALIFRFTVKTIIHPYFYPTAEFHFWNPTRFMWGIFDVFSITGIAVSIKFFRDRNANEKRTQELQQQKLNSELNFLKAQINPHFLFNTLNNIYGLSLKGSDQTPDAILKLSGMLRFIIHDGAAQNIKLRDEIKIINDYISLEKLRYGDRLVVTFEKEVENENERIAPLSLLPFVENSFKHGASESRFNASIHIKLQLQEGKLIFIVQNSKEDVAYNNNGIGLKNISRQLELTYGKFHQLEIINTKTVYEARLTINLKDHAKAQLLNS